MVETQETSKGSKKGPAQPSLADRTYHLILDKMLRGSLPLGAVLSRRELARQFKMSLVPVAQAFQRLEIEGILESRPRAGTRVKVPNPDETRERYELREALESQSARLCAERASFQERLELRRLAANVDALYAKVQPPELDGEWVFAVNKYHEELHMRIAECARSSLLKSRIENNHVLIFNWLFDLMRRQPALPPNFHRDLIEAIVNGNPQAAEEAMRRHVVYGLNSIQRTIEPLRAKSWRVKRAPATRGSGVNCR
jgi:DNA-binding GntR family transcriptional regulator